MGVLFKNQSKIRMRIVKKGGLYEINIIKMKIILKI